MRWILMHT